MRVLLVNPPSPERLGSPLLGLQYVAAALIASGVEVRVLDAAARVAPPTIRDIVREAESFRPAIIGMSLFTRWVWHAYRLLDELAGRGSWTLVAGGAHATVCQRKRSSGLRHGVARRSGAEPRARSRSNNSESSSPSCGLVRREVRGRPHPPQLRLDVAFARHAATDHAERQSRATGHTPPSAGW